MADLQDVYSVLTFPGVPSLVQDDSTPSVALANAVNLNKMIALLLDADSGPSVGTGGTLSFLPGGTYYFSGQITVGVNLAGNKRASSVILRGSAEQSRGAPVLVQLDTTVRFFYVNNSTVAGPTQNQIGGIIFQDLIITFASAADSTGGVGIYVDGGSNVRILRVTFDENPIAMWFANTLECSVISADVRTQTLDTAIGMILGDTSGDTAIETYVANVTMAAYGSNSGGTALLLYGAEHLRMNNVRLESWTNAIVFDVQAAYGNIEHCYFHNVSCLTAEAAVTMSVGSGQPPTAPTYIVECWFAQCEFEPGGGVTDYLGGGVVINATDTNDIIDQIRFVDCYSCLWAGPGLEVLGGTNIEVLGGYYSANGNTEVGPSPFSLSGIALAGAVSGVRISNVACNNSLFNIYGPDKDYATPTQLFGVYVGYGASNVRIRGCDLTGNKSHGVFIDGSFGEPSNVFVSDCDMTGVATPVQVSTPVSNVQVTNCPGYNDSQTSAMHTTLPTGVFSASGYGYYGPASFYVVNTGVIGAVTGVLINGITTGLKTGAFFLAAGQSAQVTTSGMPTVSFSMIGQ